MSISSTISIDDGFSEPLKQLSQDIMGATGSAGALGKGLVDACLFMNELEVDMLDCAIGIATDLVPSFQDTAAAAHEAKEALSDMFHDFNTQTVLVAASAIMQLGEAVADTAVQTYEIGKKLATSLFYYINGVSTFGNRVATAMTAALVNTYKTVFNSLKESISKSLDSLDISDKMTNMFGKAGTVAKQRAYDLAQEIGENAGMVTEMAAKAAVNGIGTDSFERIMKLSDKVASLSVGETTESIANALISDVKSGHSAETISSMLGGGEMLARKLKHAGYERALNRGDISKALDIAEKITEQAGFTDEKYKNSSNSIAQNFQIINNVVENLKKRLSTIYNKAFAPAVEKIAKLLQSDAFKKFTKILEFAVEKLGNFLSSIVDGLVDNLWIFGVAFGMMIATKAVLLVKLAMVIKTAFFGPVGMALKFVAKAIIGLGVKLKLLNAEMATCVSKGQAMSALGLNAIWVGIAAAAAGVAYALHKALGVSETFAGFLAGGFEFAMNIMENVAIFLVERVPNAFKKAIGYIKIGFYSFVGFIKSNVGKLLAWVVRSIADALDGTIIGDMLSGIGLDVNEMATNVEKYAATMGNGEEEKVKQIYNEMKKLGEGQTKYVSVMRGVDEAYRTGGESTLNFLKSSFGKLFNFQDKQEQGIQDANDKIKKISEQEEELRWLKAFSDRQIMSSYNSTTSNTRIININRASDTLEKEAFRRNAGRPSRAVYGG